MYLYYICRTHRYSIHTYMYWISMRLAHVSTSRTCLHLNTIRKKNCNDIALSKTSLRESARKSLHLLQKRKTARRRIQPWRKAPHIGSAPQSPRPPGQRDPPTLTVLRFFWSWTWSVVRLFNLFGLGIGQWSNFSILDLILDSGQTFQSLWSGVKLGPPRIVKFK